MATVRNRIRTVCSSCHTSCRVEPVNVMVMDRWRGYPVWAFIHLTLCPPCRVSRYDWWHDQVERAKAGLA